MMGTHQPQASLFAYRVDLEQRVRLDHPLRRVAAVLDFSFVREQVAPCYGYNGHVSVDPVVILKLMFLLFYDDVPSERELLSRLGERLDYLWFLGYGLDDPIPDHSVLSKARRRWGREVFERLFVQTVQQCVAAGLVDGHKIHLDSSLVDANAAKNSVLKSAPALIVALKTAYGTQEQKLTEPPGVESVNATLLSTTDPDATVVRPGGGGPRLRYKHHRAVDNAQGVITAVCTTTGAVDEAQQLPALVEQHEQNTAKRVGTAVADSKYGTVENYRHCQQRGITTHMADLQTKQAGTGRRAAIFPETDFVYAVAPDTYRCPGGQTLQRHHWNAARQVWQYRTRAGVCAACALRVQCTRAKDGRSLQRHEDHELVQQARAQANSAAAKRDRRRRRHLMEGSFADAANNHGFKRARWRRLWRQEIQDWLIAAIQNVRILMAHPLRPVHTAAQAARALVVLPFAGRCGFRIKGPCLWAYEIADVTRFGVN